MWRMVYDVFRFNACAVRVLMYNEEKKKEQSIGEYLEKEGYSNAFKDDYLIVSEPFDRRRGDPNPWHAAHDCSDLEHTSGQVL